MASELEQLAPGFLIAAPALDDPNFDHSLILLCAHNEHGAMGLIVNRVAPISLGEIMHQLDMEVAQRADQPALVGGPFSMESALLLYQRDAEAEDRDDELSISDELRLSPAQDLLRRIASGEGPPRYHLFLGHAGWGPGQLEQELAQGAWLPGNVDLDLIFDTPYDERWTQALRRGGLDLAALAGLTPKN